MPEQLLNVADVRAVFKQVRGKTVPQSVYADLFVDICFAHSGFENILHTAYAVSAQTSSA
jgi:hypothetical protein